jgi:hypothetical protein
MQDYLIGYLLDALEPHEQELIESRLGSDPDLRRDLQLASRSLEPLAADKAHFDPPIGLAHRTCQFVAVQTKAAPAPPVVSMPSRWSMADFLVAAGIFLAATLLFWPAINQSRFAARVTGCQNNLRQIGVSLANYSTRYPGQFPAAEIGSRLNRAGIYAVILREGGFLPQTHVLLCPASPLADRPGDFNLPTMRELSLASAEKADAMCKMMGGSYGYSLGFFVAGRYQAPKDLRRTGQALMADTPHSTYRTSSNHGGRGQNVMFEDLHVKYLTTCKAQGCNDHIFTNDEGRASAGLHAFDSVIGASNDCPLEMPIVSGSPDQPKK